MSIQSIAAVAGLLGAATASAQVDLWLTVLHNNDGESQLVDAGSGLEDFGGVARFATLVSNLRAEAESFPAGGAANGSLLISSGDNYLPGPEFNASLAKGVPFYDTIAMDLIGYDASAIGNHEFDLNPDVFEQFLAGFVNGPVFVAANLNYSNEPGLAAQEAEGRLATSTVISVEGRQVGIVGATTDNLPFITSPRNVLINDIATSVQAEIDALTAGGVNIIILTSHLQDVGEEIALASQLNDVDLIIAGGGDNLLAPAGTALVPGDAIEGPYPETGTDLDGDFVPVVTTPGDYKYVGRLIAGFDVNGNLVSVDQASGPVRVASSNQPDGVADDPEVQAQVVDPLNAALLAQQTNTVYTSGVGLDGQRSNIRSVETNLGNLIADSFLFEANRRAPDFGLGTVEVALSNGGGIRNDNIIPAGEIYEFTNFSILPFGNNLSVVENIPAAQFKEIMENAVSRLDRTIGGTGRFAQIAGFTMEIDTSRTAQDIDNGQIIVEGERVRSIVLSDGTVMVDGGVVPANAPAIDIAIVDFLANGGDQYPFNGAPFTRLGITYDRVLSTFVQDALGGEVSLLDYPGGGEGRIIQNGQLTGGIDFNLDGIVDNQDLLTFIGLFLDRSAAADRDLDGAVTGRDIREFIREFVSR